MTSAEKIQSGNRRTFLWVMVIAAVAVILFSQFSLVRRISALERLLVQAMEEQESNENHTSAVESAPLVDHARARWTPRMASDAQRLSENPDSLVDALAGSVISRMETGFSSLQGQLQKLTNALASSPGTSTSQSVPEYDPTKSPNPNDMEDETLRSWGQEQVIGPPNAVGGDDSESAWAAQEADKGPEWLLVGFERAVEAAEIRIRENHNPGGIYRVTGFINHQEVVLWEGVAAKRSGPRDFLVTVPPGYVLESVAVHLDTRRIPGVWEEIDAVELIGRDGSRQWATSAKASSSYAE